MALTTLTDLDFSEKNVFARFDFNVPLADGKITDDTRIRQALPTIQHILDEGCNKLILCSHLGRPKGEPKQEFSLEPVATHLAELLEEEVLLTTTSIDCGMKDLLKLQKNRLFMLENIRFHKEETENDHQFAKKLGENIDIYVNDAFGTCHRKHASTYGITEFFPKAKAGGFLIEKEIQALDKILETPEKPFTAIVGGAKVSDKIKIIEKLLPKVDHLLIGGAMAYPFLKAQGKDVGKSLCSNEDISLAKRILAKKTAFKIKLPVDHVVSDSLEGNPQQIAGVNIPEQKMGLDIGQETAATFSRIISESKSVLWNGPMGLFEKEAFAVGTNQVAQAIANSNSYSLVGGGDSVSALNSSGLADKISHISTGGGASLKYIEEGSLPGIQALKFGVIS